MKGPKGQIWLTLFEFQKMLTLYIFNRKDHLFVLGFANEKETNYDTRGSQNLFV